MEERINRVKQLLREIHHVPVATVNEDNTPHTSPVFMAFDKDTLTAYWVSSLAARHSQNIARNDQVFMVVFDSREGHGGLYLQARAKALDNEADASEGYDLLKQLKGQVNGSMGEIGIYLGSGSQRIYKAEPFNVWVNISERDKNGVIVGDKRCEIPLSLLIDQRVQ